jgi:hypothetical protein
MHGATATANKANQGSVGQYSNIPSTFIAQPSLIQQVQPIALGSWTSGSSLTFSYSASPLNGDFLALCGSGLAYSGNTYSIQSITQTGATWQKAVLASTTYSSGYYYITSEIWYAMNVQNAGTSVTVYYSGIPASAFVEGLEYSRMYTVNVLDQIASNSGGSTGPCDSGTTSLTVLPYELFLASLTIYGGGFYELPTNGFSSFGWRESAAALSEEVCVKTVGSISSANTSDSVFSQSVWVGTIATFIGYAPIN